MRLNRIEKEIMLSYVNSYVGSLKMNLKTAKQAAKGNIVKAKETAIKEGLYDLPTDYYKEIFRMENNNVDNKLTRYYKEARKDGVKEEDIIYLWETYPVERFMLQETQNLININVFLTAMGEGKTEQEATETVRKNFPTYGNPLIKIEYGSYEDNALPLEFIFKVNKNVLPKLVHDFKLKEELEKFSSFNAFIRYLARNDKLGSLSS